MKRIKDWPEEERPREKLLKQGATALSDAELLALVLRTGDARSGDSALDQARRIIKRFGSLAEIAQASARELCTISGVGPAKSAELLAVFELATRYANRPLKTGLPIGSAKDVFHHYRTQMKGERREQFIAILLDAKNRVLRDVVISQGSLTASIVHPREVFTPIVRDSAAAVLFVHNHPSGDPSPSREDIEITKRLREVGTLMGVRVLDHIIIGREDYFSLADESLL